MGSEMCIRDRHGPPQGGLRRAAVPLPRRPRQAAGGPRRAVQPGPALQGAARLLRRADRRLRPARALDPPGARRSRQRRPRCLRGCGTSRTQAAGGHGGMGSASQPERSCELTHSHTESMYGKTQSSCACGVVLRYTRAQQMQARNPPTRRGVVDIRGRRDFSRFDPSPGEAPL